MPKFQIEGWVRGPQSEMLLGERYHIDKATKERIDLETVESSVEILEVYEGETFLIEARDGPRAQGVLSHYLNARFAEFLRHVRVERFVEVPEGTISTQMLSEADWLDARGVPLDRRGVPLQVPPDSRGSR